MILLQRQIDEIVEIPEHKDLPAVEPDTDICGHRGQQAWFKFERLHGRVEIVPYSGFQIGVMLNVQFVANYQPGLCGEHTTYTGHAIGDLLRGASPKPEQLEHARKLQFDNCRGVFADKATGSRLFKATALFLLKGLHAAYIP